LRTSAHHGAVAPTRGPAAAFAQIRPFEAVRLS